MSPAQILTDLLLNLHAGLQGIAGRPWVTVHLPGVIGTFHPAVRTWFENRFPDGPTLPQAGGWAEIAAGRDTLIAAPTGSGKTLAAFLVCIDRLYRSNDNGDLCADGPQVVYVSPLKALAVDIHQNLEAPLRGIAEVAAELGLTAPDIRVA